MNSGHSPHTWRHQPSTTSHVSNASTNDFSATRREYYELPANAVLVDTRNHPGFRM